MITANTARQVPPSATLQSQLSFSAQPPGSTPAHLSDAGAAEDRASIYE